MHTVMLKNPFKFIMSFLKNQIFVSSLIITLGISWTISQSVFPLFIKVIVNKINELNSDQSTLLYEIKWPLSIFLLIWVIGELCMRLRDRLLTYAIPKLKTSMRQWLYDYIKNHDYIFFLKQIPGDISFKISEVPRSSETIIGIIIHSFLPLSTMIIISVLLMVNIDLQFAIITIVWFITQLYFSFVFYKECDKASKSHLKALSNVNSRIVDTVNSIMLVRLFSREEQESRDLNDIHKEEEMHAIFSMKKIEKMKATQGISGFVFIFFMFSYLLYAWHKKIITIGDFPLIVMLSISLMNLLTNLGFQISLYFKELTTIASGLRTLAREEQIKDIPEAKPLKITKGEIIFKDVGFAYNKDNSILKNLSIKIKGGEAVGLVGLSGSGKTTFINLLLRCFEIESGMILIDKQNIQRVTQKSLREQIAIIPQEPFLLHRSIKDNITYGRLDATPEEILKAIKIANCSEFIMKLPNGYDTVIGENGLRLSNGQQQRISIARAALKDAPILILDEATSALDPITEKAIQNNILNDMEGKTILIIAHRLSTLVNVDRILVFDDGNIIEDGGREELLKKEGAFYNLWKSSGLKA